MESSKELNSTIHCKPNLHLASSSSQSLNLSLECHRQHGRGAQRDGQPWDARGAGRFGEKFHVRSRGETGIERKERGEHKRKDSITSAPPPLYYLPSFSVPQGQRQLFQCACQDEMRERLLSGVANILRLVVDAGPETRDGHV